MSPSCTVRGRAIAVCMGACGSSELGFFAVQNDFPARSKLDFFLFSIDPVHFHTTAVFAQLFAGCCTACLSKNLRSGK